jgi:hypothetical protein
MKKNYIIPAMQLMEMGAESMVAASITNITGDSGIEKGTGDIPTEADVNTNPFGETLFD